MEDLFVKQIHQLASLISFILFIIITLVFILLSLVLNYHWTRYGIHENTIRKVRKLYFGLAIILWFLMLISLVLMFIYD